MHGETEVSTRSWAPPVDIYETEDAIVLKAELGDCQLEGATWKRLAQLTISMNVRATPEGRCFKLYQHPWFVRG
jgi:hypothetical protein